MLEIESRYIEQINSDPGDRATQLIYADWLDQQGDPRAEAWRVLIEAGKRPKKNEEGTYWWWDSRSYPRAFRDKHKLDFITGTDLCFASHPTFFSAMDAAAVAWVRCHRDAEFLMEGEACAICGEVKTLMHSQPVCRECY